MMCKKIELESGIWIDGYNCQEIENTFTYGKKTAMCQHKKHVILKNSEYDQEIPNADKPMAS